MQTSLQELPLPQLDPHLIVAHKVIEGGGKKFGSVFDSGEYTGARVSLIYATQRHGIHGYVKLSRWRDDSEGTLQDRVFGLSGNILIPESALLKLSQIQDADKRAVHTFKNSFGIKPTDSPSEIIDNEMLGGFQLPKGKYYHVLWGISENFPSTGGTENDATRLRKYVRCVNTLLTRMSRMEQWLNFHIDRNIFQRKPPPIPYTGLAVRPKVIVGAASEQTLSLPPRPELPKS